MELRQLRYLIEVNESSTFIKAAEHLNLAQPALSRQIQSLEKEIGSKLFVRGRRGVSLTPSGAVCRRRALDREKSRRRDSASPDGRRRTHRALRNLHVGMGALDRILGAFDRPSQGHRARHYCEPRRIRHGRTLGSVERRKSRPGHCDQALRSIHRASFRGALR